MMGKIKSTWRFIGMLALLTLFVATIHVQGTINIITNKPDNPDIIFLGEKNLDISRAMTDSVKTYSRIAWYETGDLNSQNPVIYPVGDPAHFYVDPDYFQGKLGNWYRYDGSASGVAFVVANPQLDVSVKNNNINLPVNDQSVYIGTPINFEVYTNLHTIRSRFGFVDATDGFLNITVYGPTGNSYNTLRDKMATILPLTYQIPIGNDWYWQPVNASNGWFTGYRDQSGYVYQSGKYSISAVCNANDMNTNYNSPGTTVSTTKSLTILPETVTINSNPISVLRGNTTTVTINGTPDTDYYLWVMEFPVKMTGDCCDQPPMIVPGQTGVSFDPENGPYTIGSTVVDPVAVFNNENIQIRDTVPPRPNNGVYYYAKVHTSPQGTITVQWKTTKDTAVKNYFFHVQGPKTLDGYYPSADSSFTVTKGIVTISINSTSAFLGDNVRITGTNSENDKTYLFITGPSQPTSGGKLENPRQRVRDCNFIDVSNQYPCQPCTSGCCNTSSPLYPSNEASFTIAPVTVNGNWEYIWKTKDLSIDLGQYTIYAASRPRDADHLANPPESDLCTAAASTPITINGPSITANVQPNQLIVDCNSCPTLKVTGTTTGNSGRMVQMWVFGQDMVGDQKYLTYQAPVYMDGTYSIDLGQKLRENATLLSKLVPGTYTVIMQHPSYNHIFDVYPGPLTGNQQWVMSNFPSNASKVFQIDGPGRLKGKDASDALMNNVFNITSPLRVDDLAVAATFTIGSNSTFDGKIHLQTGWNFVSTPKTLSKGNNTAAQVFGGISTGGKGIFNYDAKARVWNQLSSTDEIKPLEAYWIYSTVPTDVSLIFMNDPFLTPPTKHLEKGWNAIGYTDIISQTARDTLLSVNSLWVRALGYDATNQQWDNEISNSNPSNLNNMYPTKGYWLYMNDGGDLIALTV